jgi:hypothetical protein
MSDDEYDEDENTLSGIPNWADWANILLMVPYYFFKGISEALKSANEMLALHSRNIDDRREFSNAVHEAIENLNAKDKD